MERVYCSGVGISRQASVEYFHRVLVRVLDLYSIHQGLVYRSGWGSNATIFFVRVSIKIVLWLWVWRQGNRPVEASLHWDWDWETEPRSEFGMMTEFRIGPNLASDEALCEFC